MFFVNIKQKQGRTKITPLRNVVFELLGFRRLLTTSFTDLSVRKDVIIENTLPEIQ